jgi:two-component system LytT family sensor kinase
MKPVIFISTSILVGLLFAFQEWVSVRHMGYRVHAPIFFQSWGFQFWAWGTLSWLLWRFLRKQVQTASITSMLALFLPLSVVVSIAQQMIFVFLFPSLPLGHKLMSYWERLSVYVYAELLNNLLIFWCAFFLFRGLGYYQRYRNHEREMSELEVQLANARIAALRMQLNPHFLFNTMNSISSLMRIDIDAADTMLEQLSCLMRMSLERGEAPLISLREEADFVELYLAMQGRRYAGRVEQAVWFDPELYDALVPAMLLQPIVENAFIHGLSKIETDGSLVVDVGRHGDQMKVTVINSGLGLNPCKESRTSGHGVGLTNIMGRLNLHYGAQSSCVLEELDSTHVQVTILLPLQFSTNSTQPLTRFETR